MIDFIDFSVPKLCSVSCVSEQCLVQGGCRGFRVSTPCSWRSWWFVVSWVHLSGRDGWLGLDSQSGSSRLLRVWLGVKESLISVLHMRLWCWPLFYGCLNIDQFNTGHCVQIPPKCEPRIWAAPASLMTSCSSDHMTHFKACVFALDRGKYRIVAGVGFFCSVVIVIWTAMTALWPSCAVYYCHNLLFPSPFAFDAKLVCTGNRAWERPN